MEYGLVVIWLVAYLALGLAALPVASVVLERLPDRGAGVALPLALVLVALPAYWVGQVAYGWPALAAGLLVLLAAGAAAWRRSSVDPEWTAARDSAVVFAVVFMFMVAVRAVDPAVHPLFGEKFLDYGLLKALDRAPALPPEDFWFAGESVAYYYGGHMMASLLSTLTGTAPAYAYNLALAGFYAMFVTAAFGVGGALGHARGTTRRGAGLASAFFVAFASNLATPARALGGYLPSSVLATAAPEKAETFAQGLAAFNYWPASRAMKARVITEFPLFAWLNGDMHAHMMSPPFALLVVALLLAYYRTPEEEVRRRRLLVFGAVPVVGGLLSFVSTWTTFTPAGLTALTLYFAPSDPETLLPEEGTRFVRRLAGTGGASSTAADGGAPDASAETSSVVADAGRVLRAEGVRGITAGAGAFAVLVVGLVYVAPFLLGAASARQVAIWEASRRSGLGGLLVAHGGFLLVFAAFLRQRLRPLVPGSGVRVLGALAVVFALGVVHGFAAFGLLVPLVLVAWLLLRSDAADDVPADAGEAAAQDDAADSPEDDAAYDGVGADDVEAMDDEGAFDDDGATDAAASTDADDGTRSDADDGARSDATTPPVLNGDALATVRSAVVNAVQTVGINLFLLAAAYLVVDAVVGVIAPTLVEVLGPETALSVVAPAVTVLGTFGVLVAVDWPGLWLEASDGTPARPERADQGVGFETLLVVAGAGLVFIVEVLYVNEYAAPGRFNTVFKTYSQVWTLWAAAAGAVLVATVGRHLPAAAVRGGGDADIGPSLQSRFAVGAALLLVLSLSLYGGLAMTNHFTGNSVYPKYQRVDDPTLNATAFLEEGHPDEAPAIRWLDRRSGTPTIVGTPGLYYWTPSEGKSATAPASLTGLPTVVGWPHHERGFRGPDAGIDQRVADVDAIYTAGTDKRACLLAKYDVQYVYVGPAERASYDERDLRGLSGVSGVSVAETFSRGAVVIYEVDQDELAADGYC